MKKLILGIILIPMFACAGNDRGGGGDVCEDRIKIIRDDLKDWINKGGPKGLILSSGVGVEQYSEVMLNQIAKANIRCVSKGDAGYPVQFEGTPKVCQFDLASEQLTCDFAKFNSTNESDQYVLVHHEYAGLAQIETPTGTDSNYNVSNQITGYLEDQVMKKLVVSKSTATIKIFKFMYPVGHGLRCDKTLETADKGSTMACIEAGVVPYEVDIGFFVFDKKDQQWIISGNLGVIKFNDIKLETQKNLPNMITMTSPDYPLYVLYNMETNTGKFGRDISNLRPF